MSVGDKVREAAQMATQAVMGKLVPLAPDSWIPGGKPDPLIRHKHGLVGTSVSRIDGPAKVEGQARFAAEFAMDGMCYAALAFGTIAKGRIAAFDLAETEASPGVVLVMTHLNAPKMERAPVFGTSANAVGPDDLAVMQDDRLHWNGQPIALVLAETQEQADHAASLVRATYHAEPPVTSMEEGVARGLEPARFNGEPLKLEVGDAETALAAAPHKIDAVYRTPRHNHNPIESTRSPSPGTATSSGSTTQRRRSSRRPGPTRRCSGSSRNRSASPRPMSAAGSAARYFGSTTSWRRRPPSWPIARSG